MLFILQTKVETQALALLATVHVCQGVGVAFLLACCPIHTKGVGDEVLLIIAEFPNTAIYAGVNTLTDEQPRLAGSGVVTARCTNMNQ